MHLNVLFLFAQKAQKIRKPIVGAKQIKIVINPICCETEFLLGHIIKFFILKKCTKNLRLTNSNKFGNIPLLMQTI